MEQNYHKLKRKKGKKGLKMLRIGKILGRKLKIFNLKVVRWAGKRILELEKAKNLEFRKEIFGF